LSVAIVTQHAKHMHHIILSSVAFWLYHVCLHYLINGTIFGKKVIVQKVCVLIFSTTFV